MIEKLQLPRRRPYIRRWSLQTEHVMTQHTHIRHFGCLLRMNDAHTRTSYQGVVPNRPCTVHRSATIISWALTQIFENLVVCFWWKIEKLEVAMCRSYTGDRFTRSILWEITQTLEIWMFGSAIWFWLCWNYRGVVHMHVTTPRRANNEHSQTHFGV